MNEWHVWFCTDYDLVFYFCSRASKCLQTIENIFGFHGKQFFCIVMHLHAYIFKQKTHFPSFSSSKTPNRSTLKLIPWHHYGTRANTRWKWKVQNKAKRRWRVALMISRKQWVRWWRCYRNWPPKKFNLNKQWFLRLLAFPYSHNTLK